MSKLDALINMVLKYDPYTIMYNQEEKLSLVKLNNKNNIYISDFNTSKKIYDLNNNNIKYVLYIGNQKKKQKVYDNYIKNNINYSFFELDDDENAKLTDILDETYNLINDNLKNGNVLVHCQAGMSRSVSLVLYYLMKSNEYDDIIKGMEYIKECRIIADPNIGFLKQIFNKLYN